MFSRKMWAKGNTGTKAVAGVEVCKAGLGLDLLRLHYLFTEWESISVVGPFDKKLKEGRSA